MFHFPTADRFHKALEKPKEWYLLLQVRIFIVKPLLYEFVISQPIWLKSGKGA